HERALSRKMLAIGPNGAHQVRKAWALTAPSRPKAPAVFLGLLEPQFQPMTLRPNLRPAADRFIEQHPHRPVVVRDNDVDVAVVVDVAKRRAAANLRSLQRRAALRGHVPEAAVRLMVQPLVALVERQRLA